MIMCIVTVVSVPVLPVIYVYIIVTSIVIDMVIVIVDPKLDKKN